MYAPAKYDTAISTGLGLPVWVNHIVLRGTPERVEQLKATLEIEGINPEMAIDHGRCTSICAVDPNGILVEYCIDTPGFVRDEAEALRVMRTPSDPAGALHRRKETGHG